MVEVAWLRLVICFRVRPPEEQNDTSSVRIKSRGVGLKMMERLEHLRFEDTKRIYEATKVVGESRTLASGSERITLFKQSLSALWYSRMNMEWISQEGGKHATTSVSNRTKSLYIHEFSSSKRPTGLRSFEAYASSNLFLIDSVIHFEILDR